jgi:hypothetical protein
MSFRFRLFLEDGTNLDDYVTAVPGPWNPGDLLYDGGRAAWRITSVIPLSDAYLDYAGIWQVAPLGEVQPVR